MVQDQRTCHETHLGAVSQTTGYGWRTSFNTTRPKSLQRLRQHLGAFKELIGERNFGASEFSMSV